MKDIVVKSKLSKNILGIISNFILLFFSFFIIGYSYSGEKFGLKFGFNLIGILTIIAGYISFFVMVIF